MEYKDFDESYKIRELKSWQVIDNQRKQFNHPANQILEVVSLMRGFNGTYRLTEYVDADTGEEDVLTGFRPDSS
jgi:hypothetical protein